ncbi:MAG: Radical SAM domain protein [Candidatus Woesebacteria bacterium GW2011_GWB1_39_12]|uniref:Radical SAM domain protein n=1 Tax=Candidatus Woesebacteria bacterium GW2011_GWB1_39_12 TaxID=1618574 RepID=A0A0G0M2Z6_9BACT|nr:MAG: Radical SAM domain protein [Candidatus Woesebacteria bacterium GW2011_GWB1_39_12]
MTGGEPLVNKKVVFSGIEKLRKNNITVGINSNLIPLKPRDAKLIKTLGVSGVLTSLLGPDANSHEAITLRLGSFNETIRGIRLLQEARVPVMVNMVVSKDNKHLLRATAELVKRLGITRFYSTRAACPGNCSDFSGLALSLDEFRAYLKEFHQIGVNQGLKVGVLESYPLCGMKDIDLFPELVGRRCLAGVTSLTIGANCDIRPCSHLDTTYGNILSEDLVSIWKKMQDWRTGAFLPETCKFCKLLPKCGGGCRMEAKMINGSLNALDPYSSLEDIQYVLSLENKREKTWPQPLPPTFQLNPKIRWRDESFGSIAYLGQRSGCFLNRDATEFVKKLRLGRNYQTCKIVSKYGEGTKEFLQGLCEKKVLISI